jgi:hypothetical protein
MKSFIYTICLIVSFLVSISGQRVLVLNEGAVDFQTGKILEPVSIGAYSLNDKQYKKLFDIPDMRFASDLQPDGDSYWVAADRKILRYRLQDDALISEFNLSGVRRILPYGDLLIVTRGEYLQPLSAYVQIYDKNSFDLKFEIPAAKLNFTTENIAVSKDLAYIAVNNGFDFGNEVGKVLVIDLKKLEWTGTIELGDEGKNPENLMLHGDELFTLNNRNFTDGSTISRVDLNGLKLSSTTRLPNVSSLCGTSVLVGSAILYQESGKTDIGAYDILTGQAGPYTGTTASYYGLSYDARSQTIAGAETDFFSFGKVYLMDRSFMVREEFQAGISPGYFIFDYSRVSSTKNASKPAGILVSNMATDQLLLKPGHQLTSLQIAGADGNLRTLTLGGDAADISFLAPGVYQLSALQGSTFVTERFVKF